MATKLSAFFDFVFGVADKNVVNKDLYGSLDERIFSKIAEKQYLMRKSSATIIDSTCGSQSTMDYPFSAFWIPSMGRSFGATVRNHSSKLEPDMNWQASYAASKTKAILQPSFQHRLVSVIMKAGQQKLQLNARFQKQ
uniref:Uncharacterized protein n=1 Tax=Panagrolaimus sp. JU765 TaxID=591449 RepID=A0AC34PVP7_9BILA